jgi:hypothetical protein
MYLAHSFPLIKPASFHLPTEFDADPTTAEMPLEVSFSYENLGIQTSLYHESTKGTEYQLARLWW